MCLAVPGKVLETSGDDSWRMATLDFGGIHQEACLAYTPDAGVGDYVLVHAGFAISKIDEAHAREVFDTLKELDENLEKELQG